MEAKNTVLAEFFKDFVAREGQICFLDTIHSGGRNEAYLVKEK